MRKISKYLKGKGREESQVTPNTTTSGIPLFPDGVKVWVDCPDATIDVCFVHGLTGDRDTTWTAHGQSVPWPKTLLPDRLPNARLLTYGYDAYVVRKSVSSTNTLIDHATNLLNDLTNDRISCDATSRRIIFVAHSLGGLVCKEVILQSRNNPEAHLRDLFPCVVGVLFMGTPHKGSGMADWATIPVRTLGVFKSTNKTLLEILSTENRLLQSIQRSFLLMARELRESGRRFEVTCFFEELPLAVLDRVVVSKESATFESYTPLGIHANHSNMVKFGSAEDNGFKRLLGELMRWEREHRPASNSQQIVRGAASSGGASADSANTVRAVKRHYVVPLETVASYTQRDELWLELEEKMRIRHEQANVPFAVAIHGLGGTGKSQLALKYVESHKSRYNPILWIDATDEEAARSSFERCAAELGLPQDQTEKQNSTLADGRAVQAVLRWLRDRTPAEDEWLVVIDNADDFHWGLNKVIPAGDRGSIIITSQDNLSPKLIPKGCERLRVDVMSPSEATTLLLRHLSRDINSASSDIRRNCEEIVQSLGFLALAIDLAGAYISNDPNLEHAISQYLSDLTTHRDELLRMDSFRGLLPTEKTVWTVWDKTLQKLTDDHAPLQPGILLNFLAHFKGSIIQDEMFRLAAIGSNLFGNGFIEHLPAELRGLLAVHDEEWDSFQYRQSCDILVRYSLLQRVDDAWPGVTMHGLVRWRTLRSGQSRQWPSSYVAFIGAACYQMVEERQRPEFRRHLIVHIPDIHEVFGKGIDLTTHEASIAEELGMVYYDEGRWYDAEELDVQVMEARKTKLGTDHPDTLYSMSNLALTYWKQGRLDEAEELHLQAIEARKTKLGADHPDTLNSVADLASTYGEQGRLDEAEVLEVQVMEARKTKLRADHPDTLHSMSNLASTYRRQRRLDEAEELDVQVVEIRKMKLRADHPQTLRSMSNLASTYWAQGRYDEAEELDLQVMEIRKTKLGADHPETLSSIGRLAFTWKAQGRLNKAIELMEQCVQSRIRVLRPEHPKTKSSLSTLQEWRAEALHKLKRLQSTII